MPDGDRRLLRPSREIGAPALPESTDKNAVRLEGNLVEPT